MLVKLREYLLVKIETPRILGALRGVVSEPDRKAA